MPENKVYKKEITDWLITNTNKMKSKTAFELFQKQFPDVKVSYASFKQKRSDLAITEHQLKTRCRPLYSERICGKRLCIKVQLSPSKWVSKQSWIYKETHPEELNEIRLDDCFVFADGNTNNFAVENIIRVPIKFMANFIRLGGVVKGNADATKINLARAKLNSSILDCLEDLGEVCHHTGTSRVTKEKSREARRRYLEKVYSDPEKLKIYKEKINERNKTRWANLTEEQKIKQRQRAREWARKKRKNMSEVERAGMNRKQRESLAKRRATWTEQDWEKERARKRAYNAKYKLLKIGVTK